MKTRHRQDSNKERKGWQGRQYSGEMEGKTNTPFSLEHLLSQRPHITCKATSNYISLSPGIEALIQEKSRAFEARCATSLKESMLTALSFWVLTIHKTSWPVTCWLVAYSPVATLSSFLSLESAPIRCVRRESKLLVWGFPAFVI